MNTTNTKTPIIYDYFENRFNRDDVMDGTSGVTSGFTPRGFTVPKHGFCVSDDNILKFIESLIELEIPITGKDPSIDTAIIPFMEKLGYAPKSFKIINPELEKMGIINFDHGYCSISPIGKNFLKVRTKEERQNIIHDIECKRFSSVIPIIKSTIRKFGYINSVELSIILDRKNIEIDYIFELIESYRQEIANGTFDNKILEIVEFANNRRKELKDNDEEIKYSENFIGQCNSVFKRLNNIKFFDYKEKRGSKLKNGYHRLFLVDEVDDDYLSGWDKAKDNELDDDEFAKRTPQEQDIFRNSVKDRAFKKDELLGDKMENVGLIASHLCPCSFSQRLYMKGWITEKQFKLFVTSKDNGLYLNPTFDNMIDNRRANMTIDSKTLEIKTTGQNGSIIQMMINETTPLKDITEEMSLFLRIHNKFVFKGGDIYCYNDPDEFVENIISDEEGFKILNRLLELLDK
jgi:hypothetical protein